MSATIFSLFHTHILSHSVSKSEVFTENMQSDTLRNLVELVEYLNIGSEDSFIPDTAHPKGPFCCSLGLSALSLWLYGFSGGREVDFCPWLSGRLFQELSNRGVLSSYQKWMGHNWDTVGRLKKKEGKVKSMSPIFVSSLRAEVSILGTWEVNVAGWWILFEDNFGSSSFLL